MDFDVKLPDLGPIVKGMKAKAKAAITLGMVEVTDGLKRDLRQQVVSAGLGQRLANTWQGKVYPEGRTSLTPAGYVYSKAPEIIDAFTKGATIRPVNGSGYIWIPTDNVPLARGRRFGRGGRVIKGTHMTPEEVENLFNTDFIVLRGKQGGLLAFMELTRSRNGRGFRRNTPGRARQGRTAERTLMFVLKRTVKMPKLLSPDVLAQKWLARLPAFVQRRWSQ